MSLFNDAFSALPTSPRMPTLFVGHGNPMNAILDNDYSRKWREWGEALPAPAAVLCVSAHWMTRGTTLVHVGRKPQTIHDFGGFPRALFAQQYPAPGSPEFAQATIDLLASNHIEPDLEWGLDHGAWSVLINMFPKADIPVFQLSVDITRSPSDLLALAAELRPLRDKGVLIIGSGNLVHNLRALAPGAEPYDWAIEFDTLVADSLEQGDLGPILHPEALGQLAQLAHPTIDHLLPILFPLAIRDRKDDLNFFNTSFDLGSISMRSFVLS